MATNYNYFGNLVTSGLVLDLDAAKLASYPGTGTTWYDISGNNLTGSLVNGPTFTGIGKQAAIVFDGSDDIAIMNSGSYYIKNSGEPITVNTWIKPGRLSGQYQDIITNRFSTEYNWILYQHTNDGSIQFHGATQNKSAYVPLTGSWVNVTATINPSKIYTIYFNGSPYQTSSSFEYGPNAQNRLSIGNGAYTTTFEPYLGSVSVAQIYNRALSQFEVWQNFNAIKGRYGIPDIVTNGLVLNLDAGNPYSYLSGSSGTTWTNTVAVSSSISGTLVNGPVYANGAISFDGTNDYVGTNYTSTSYNNTTQIIWYKWNGVNQLVVLSYLGASSGNGFGFLLSDGSNSGIAGNKIGVLYGGSYYNALNTGSLYASLTSSQWCQLTITRDSSSTILYQNGNLIGSTSRIPNTAASYNFSYGDNTYGAAGNISNVQFYNRALSATEITQNFNALRGRYGI